MRSWLDPWQPEDLVLVTEVVVERGARDSGAICDLDHVGLRETLLPHQSECSRHEGIASLAVKRMLILICTRGI